MPPAALLDPAPCPQHAGKSAEQVRKEAHGKVRRVLQICTAQPALLFAEGQCLRVPLAPLLARASFPTVPSSSKRSKQVDELYNTAKKAEL